MGRSKFLEEYGERLVCVRYRYDESGRRRLKTVELAVEETAWHATPPPKTDTTDGHFGGLEMIIRLWRGRVPSARAEEYEEYQRQVGPPGYRVIPGNRGIFMLGQDHGEQYEIAMLTMWESWNAIRAFAGDPVDKARYYDRDFDFLVDPPDKVEHFNVVAAEGIRDGVSVVRLWRGTTDASRAKEALELEAETGIPAYRRIAGNRGIYLLDRGLGDHHEVTMLTLWDSLSSIRDFAGDPPDRANYDEYLRLGHDYLIDRPDRVDHFDVLEVENVDPRFIDAED